MIQDINPQTKINPFRKNIKLNHTNKTNNIIIDGVDTHIPDNLPCYICAEKGQGKTTLIKSIMETCYKNKVFDHVYFIYSSVSIDEELPNYITKISVEESVNFLQKFFEIKSIFNSYGKFFKKAKLNDTINQEQFFKQLDNNIIKYNEGVINQGLDTKVLIDKIIDVGDKIIKTFSKPFKIGSVKIDGLQMNQMDALIIDDIAIMASVLFQNMKNNEIYKYFTLTRHMKLFILLAGQQIDQLPKMLRREIMCYMVSKNTNLELLKGVIPKSVIERIYNKQQDLKKYEFVIYNKEYDTIDII